MKVAVLLAYAVLSTRGVTGAAIRAPLDIISLDDISQSDRGALQFLHHYHYPPRGKRSGEDPLSSIKAAIGQGIKSKLSLLAKGSAAASSKLSSSSSSSKGHSFHHHDGHSDPHSHKSFDLWSLKKSILNTLLQAVKAIKGGVIAIKGQLIKGSGYLISAKGKLISSKGESITNLGKNIAASAVLSPSHGHSEGYSQGHYQHSSPEEYGSPSAPGPEYDVPEHHYHHHEDKPDSGPAGILILKKIPTHGDHPEHKVPDFKPIEHGGPSFGEIIGKFFSASTSLTPGYPGPFGDHHHPSDDHDHSHNDQHDHHPPPDDHHHHAQPDGHHHHPQPDDHHHHHEQYHDSHHVPHSSHADSHPHGYASSSSHEHLKAPSHFEQAPGFLDLTEYASETKISPQTLVKLPGIQTMPEALKLQAAAATHVTYDSIQPSPLSFSHGTGYDPSSFTLDSQTPNLFDVSLSVKPTAAFPQVPQNPVALPSIPPTGFIADFTNLKYGDFPSPAGTDIKFLEPPLEPQSLAFPRQNGFSDVNSPSPYPQSVRDHAFLDTAQSAVIKVLMKESIQSKNNSYLGFPQVQNSPYLDTAQSTDVKPLQERPTRSKNNLYSGYPQSVKNHGYMDSVQSAVYKELMKRPNRSKNSSRKRPRFPRPSFSKSPRPDNPLQQHSSFTKTLHLGPDRPKRL